MNACEFGKCLTIVPAGERFCREHRRTGKKCDYAGCFNWCKRGGKFCKVKHAGAYWQAKHRISPPPKKCDWSVCTKILRKGGKYCKPHKNVVYMRAKRRPHLGLEWV